jgi:hypothetical protein
VERRRLRERVAEVPFLRAPIGPGRPWHTALNRRKSFPAPRSSDALSSELLMAQLVSDPAMDATLGSYDIALLDTSEQGRSTISPVGLYVIERRAETVLRYIRFGAHWHYLVTDADWDSPMAWEPFMLPGARFQDAVKARVVWLGRERDRDARPQRGRFLYDPISS